MIDAEQSDFGGTPAERAADVPMRRLADPDAEPALSIVTPFFDPGPVFAETAASVRVQTLQQWEWIVVDDASRDEASIAALDALARSDPRVRVLHHETNRGRCAARNTAVAAARSGFIYLLDHDDQLEPTALEKSLWCALTRPDCAFVNGWSVAFGAQELLWPRGFERGTEFLDHNVVSGRALVRRDVLEAVGGFDESITRGFEDWDLWLRCAAQGFWGITIPEYLDWFRRHDPPAEWEQPGRAEAFRAGLEERYPDLYAGSFPEIPMLGSLSREAPDEALPFANALAADAPSALLWIARLDAGGGQRTLARALRDSGRQLLVAAATEGEGATSLRDLTDDVHVLATFLPPEAHPRHLRHLAASRGADIVVLEAGPIGAAYAAYLRGAAPELSVVELDPSDQTGSDVAEALAAALASAGSRSADPSPARSAEAPATTSREAALADAVALTIDLVEGELQRMRDQRARQQLEAEEEARRWHESQAEQLREELDATRRWFEARDRDRVGVIEDQKRWIATLEEARQWHEENAERLETELAEQQRWIERLEEAKRWNDEHRTRIEAQLGEREAEILEQRGWIEKLEETRDWLDGQRQIREREVEYLRAEVERGRSWFRRRSRGSRGPATDD